MKGRAKLRFDKIMTEQAATTVSTTKARRDQNLYGLSVHLNLVLLRTHSWAAAQAQAEVQESSIGPSKTLWRNASCSFL